MNPAFPNKIRSVLLRKSGVNRLPSWFKQELPDEATWQKLRLLDKLNVHTVCQEAGCPNLNFCFKHLKLTFMILGDICTRNCRFCAVKKQGNLPLGLDLDEPYRIQEAVRKLGLNYVVITSVSRDDLDDGGAMQFAKSIELILTINKDIKVEVLIPDFNGNISSLKCVLDACPNVVTHNIETIGRLYKDLRPMANYALSLDILRKIKKLNSTVVTKSSLLLGLGETEGEAINTMEDLRYSQCDVLTLGQYLAPSVGHYPVREFIVPEQFEKYRQIGLSLGFKAVLSGPKVRSSYQAEELYKEFAYV